MVDTNSNIPVPNIMNPNQQYQMGQYANQLLNNNGQKVQSPMQGIAELINSAIGGYLMNKAYPMQNQNLSGSTLGNTPQNNNGGMGAVFSGLMGASPPPFNLPPSPLTIPTPTS